MWFVLWGAQRDAGCVATKIGGFQSHSSRHFVHQMPQPQQRGSSVDCGFSTLTMTASMYSAVCFAVLAAMLATPASAGVAGALGGAGPNGEYFLGDVGINCNEVCLIVSPSALAHSLPCTDDGSTYVLLLVRCVAK